MALNRICIGAVLALAGVAYGDVVPVQAQRDNTLYEDPTGSLSNGSGPGMFCGRTGTGGTRRALVRFDVAGAIPAGATINSVTLTLNVSQSVSPEVPVSLHRLLADWGEGASVSSAFGGGMGAPAAAGDATWLHTFYNTQTWATPGGDFASAPSATRPVGGIGPYTWSSTPAMVADVQSWLDTPGTNYGWLVGGDESTIGTAKRFDTHEYPITPNRPVLAVEFTPGCYADCNEDTKLTVSDFGCFQTKFVAGDPYADCNGDFYLTVADFGCFQTEFVAGCP